MTKLDPSQDSNQAPKNDAIRQEALHKLRKGDYDFAVKSIAEGKVSLDELMEDVNIYQAELEIQNDELRESQLRTERAVRDFSDLFENLPLPALVINESCVIVNANAQAEARFNLRRKLLINHLLPRFLVHEGYQCLRELISIAKGKGAGVSDAVAMRSSDGEHFIADIHLNLLQAGTDIQQQFAVLIVDQTESVAQRRALLHSQDVLSERIKVLTAIYYAISKEAQESDDLGSFLHRVLELIPSGMLHPGDVCATLVLGDKIYPGHGHGPMSAEMTVKIHAGGNSIGELRIGCKGAQQNRGGGFFLPEEQSFVAAVAELVGGCIERLNARRLSELVASRNAALLEMTNRAAGMKDAELLKFALEQVERLTNSTISYAHFVNDDQQSVQFGIWSANTLRMCEALHDDHYPISKAGIWADAFRYRRPVVHNDYPAQADRRGLPPGHVALKRHMSVPVIDGDKVVIIMGVGNKSQAYDEGDQALLEMVSSSCWALLQRNRAMAQLNLNAAVFRHSREGVVITDASERILSVNQAFTRITGYAADEVMGVTPRLLKSDRHTLDYYADIWSNLMTEGYWQGEIWGRRKNEEDFPLWMSICSVKDDEGMVSKFIGIFTDISDRKEAMARIEFLANHDALTRLPNRSLLLDRARQALVRAERNRGKVGLIFLDLDHFKNINDSLGHPVGDQLLVELAARLNACVRESDTVCRLGGDEFVVLVEGINHADNLSTIAEKILVLLDEPFLIQGKVLIVRCSLGISLYPEDGADCDTLMKKADTALYQAKGTGRNKYQFFTEEMNRRVLRNLQLESDMRRAVDEREFYLEYQPQFDLSSGRIVGMEALLRWQHPTLGLISPTEFIPVAEDNGFIVELGHRVLHEACRQNRIWHDQGHRLKVAVNVSSVQFNQEKLLNMVRDVLQESGLPSESLELELTESILISNTENNLNVVRALHDEGVHFSIDDFGTGYSNLSYLKRFSVSRLKIDRSFIQDIPNNKDDGIIVSAIINMAASLGIKCIAEGVETLEQLEFLKQNGCYQAQGFLLGLPLSKQQLSCLLALQIDSSP